MRYSIRIALILSTLTAALVSGQGRAPGNKLRFVKDAKGGSNPQFVVQDEYGAKWRVKIGTEAKPETASSCLVRTAGYGADVDYYRPQIQVAGIQAMEHSQEFVSKGGIVRDVRFERNYEGAKSPKWSWHKNPAVSQRQFNGLRITMALINNWDLKDSNNRLNTGGRLVVADLGASLGKTGDSFTRSKGDVEDFAKSKFIDEITPTHVDFVMHSRPMPLLAVFNPKYYGERVRMEKIVKNIPIADARWFGRKMAQVPPARIRQCFAAAGYSREEIQIYTGVILERIHTLKAL